MASVRVNGIILFYLTANGTNHNTQVWAKLDPNIYKNPAKGGQRYGKKAGGTCLHSPVRPFFLHLNVF
jgi:hypothetical protein